MLKKVKTETVKTCIYCSTYQTVYSSNLSKHQINCSKNPNKVFIERPQKIKKNQYNCPYCDKNYLYECRYQEHLYFCKKNPSKQKSIETHECTYCDSTFEFKSYLTRHLVTCKKKKYAEEDEDESRERRRTLAISHFQMLMELGKRDTREYKEYSSLFSEFYDDLQTLYSHTKLFSSMFGDKECKGKGKYKVKNKLIVSKNEYGFYTGVMGETEFVYHPPSKKIFAKAVDGKLCYLTEDDISLLIENGISRTSIDLFEFILSEMVKRIDEHYFSSLLSLGFVKNKEVYSLGGVRLSILESYKTEYKGEMDEQIIPSTYCGDLEKLHMYYNYKMENDSSMGYMKKFYEV
jgi:hypothetical protein